MRRLLSLVKNDMSLLNRNNNYKEKKKRVAEYAGSGQIQPPLSGDLSITEIETVSPSNEASVTEQASVSGAEGLQAPASVMAPTGDLSISETNTTSPLDKADVVRSGTTVPATSENEVPDFVKAGSYEELVKKDPSWSRSAYLHKLEKYRRENGLPDLSYLETINILKGQDPYETEAERQKREKNLKIAERINAVGSFLNALVNYNRVSRGHVGYTPDKGTEGYNRIQRLRQGREQLARSNAKDYLGIMAQDRAERAKAEAAAAAKQQREREYQYKEEVLKFKIENAKNERDRKAAADELARLKFDYQKEKDAAMLEERRRHNKATEKISRERISGGSGSNKYLELETRDGKKRFTPGEHGSNWVHRAYQEMLKQPGGKDFEIQKLWGNGSSAPTEQEMYEAITKYNESQWKYKYKSSRYGSGSDDKPPLD